jgi:hypothetical protein
MLDEHDTIVAKLFFRRIGNQATHFIHSGRLFTIESAD